MPCATRGNYTRPDVYGILSGECRCLCAAGLTLATVEARARGSRVENVSTRGRPTRHQRRPGLSSRPAMLAGLWPATPESRRTGPGGDPGAPGSPGYHRTRWRGSLRLAPGP